MGKLRASEGTRPVSSRPSPVSALETIPAYNFSSEIVSLKIDFIFQISFRFTAKLSRRDRDLP